MNKRHPQLPPKYPPYAHYIKRPADLLLSLSALILLAPLLLLIALLLCLVQGGNPFFCQARIGYRGKLFRLIKFRTMNNHCDSEGRLLPDRQRTTRIGSFLRKSSLDELPEILNVIRGDMSLIGPRPWIPEQMQCFPLRTRTRRMQLRPGISGLAQVLGRNAFTFRQRICCDLYYQRHLSPATDVWIILQTVGKVLRRDGIEQNPEALSFTGRNTEAS